MADQYKFQFSSAKQNGEILVVRGDDWSSFKGDVDIARIWLNNEEKHEEYVDDTKNETIGVIASEETVKAIAPQSKCEEHNIQMVKNKNGKWYHREYSPNKGARFCNGYQWGEWQ